MTKKSGFTLLELAIVLAIIGLIAGGIVAGSSMIRSAELRSLITELSQIRTSIATFQTKYNELPGDMTSATRIWGAAHATPATCLTSVGTGTETCNGDGDGILEKLTGGGNRYSEIFTFWQHLDNAELISGEYTGRAGPGSSAHSTSDNAYELSFPNGYLTTFNAKQAISGSTNWFDGDYYKNYIQIAGIDPADTASNDVPLLNPREVWAIDAKLDNGKPSSGLIRERHWGDCTDAANSADIDADYLLSETQMLCQPIVYDFY